MNTKFITLIMIAALFNPIGVTHAWNRPGHMVSATIAYQVLEKENPGVISKTVALLETHPWFQTEWQKELATASDNERGLRLFSLASRWPDDIRTTDKKYNRPPWHYINFPFKPAREPDLIPATPPSEPNIITALRENERIARSDANHENRAAALAWLFHLVGDIHQPLHSIQRFSREYPDGDRGGNEICVRATEKTKPVRLHMLWDNLITSSQSQTVIRNLATALRNWLEFSRSNLGELASTEFEAWAKESYEIGTAITYQNGALVGTPKKRNDECSVLQDAAVLPTGYVATAKRIADRRIILSGYRLADLLKRMFER